MLRAASKALPNEGIIATIEDVAKDFKKEEVDAICLKIRFTIQNSKPAKDNLSKNEHKVLNNYNEILQL